MVSKGVRIVLGLLFVVMSANAYLGFMPMPPMNEQSMAFISALIQSAYLWPLLKLTEFVAGALLLANRYVPLALVLLAPIVLNIFFFHLALDGSPRGVIMGTVILAMTVYLARENKDAYESLLK